LLGVVGWFYWLGGDWDVFVWLVLVSWFVRQYSKITQKCSLDSDWISNEEYICKLSAGTTLHPHFNFYATFAGSTLLLRNNHTGYSNMEVIYSVAGSISFGNKGIKAAVVTLRGVYDTVIGSDI
jgi:hypothetical protein